MYCFNFFRNQLWQHLISYNSFRNMDMCLLEVAMCEKFRSSHFQWEGGVQSLGTGGRSLKNFRSGEGYQFGGTFSGGGGGGVSTSWHDMLLSSTYWPFSLCKIFKKFLPQTQSYDDAPFLDLIWTICSKQFFFWKINIILMFLLAHFIEQNVKKKFFQRIQSYEDVQLLGPKWPISPNEKFFQKTC